MKEYLARRRMKRAVREARLAMQSGQTGADPRVGNFGPPGMDDYKKRERYEYRMASCP